MKKAADVRSRPHSAIRSGEFKEYYPYRSLHQTQNHRYLWPAVFAELNRFSLAEGRILDAGCGNGAFCRKIASATDLEVYGCDLSESGIAMAQEHVPECRFERVSLYSDLSEVFGVRFDVVVSVEVIEHLYDPKAFIASVRNSLSPGGHIILTTPFHGYWKNLGIALVGKCDSHYNPLPVGGHIKFWSKRTICTFLESSGFRIRRVAAVGRLPGLWKSMVVVAQPR